MAGDRAMKIIFIRHPESTKNVSKSFSSHENQEPLTTKGEQQVEDVTKVLRENLSGGQAISLYSATSLRAMALSDAIGQVLGIHVTQQMELNSINSGNVAGLNKSQMDKIVPGYFHRMELYESGVVNAYAIDHPGEPLVEFESRLRKLLSSIEEKDAVAIVVAHKSAITAALIDYARKAGIYPDGFFGYIPLETAQFSIVSIANRVPRIDCVNVSALGAFKYER
jgi:broad specificity phosphatase PhoE